MSNKAPTLFDFDDLFSEEPIKSEVSDPPKTQHAQPDAAATPSSEEAPQERDEGSFPENDGACQTDEIETSDDTDKPEAEALPDAEPPAADTNAFVRPNLELPGSDTLPALADELMDEDDLDAQMKTELIASGYTGLIHRDYPFESENENDHGQSAPAESEADPPSDVEPRPTNPSEKVPAVSTENAEAAHTEASVNSELPDGDGHDASDDADGSDAPPLPEWNLDKNYYSIGEVAHLFGVKISHIRFWTTEFKMKPRTTRKGDRLYNPEQIAELRLIYHLVKEKKYTLKGARDRLKVEKAKIERTLDLKDSLVRLKGALTAMRDQLS